MFISPGPPVTVRCGFYVISFGPFSGVNMVSKNALMPAPRMGALSGETATGHSNINFN